MVSWLAYPARRGPLPVGFRGVISPVSATRSAWLRSWAEPTHTPERDVPRQGEPADRQRSDADRTEDKAYEGRRGARGAPAHLPDDEQALPREGGEYRRRNVGRGRALTANGVSVPEEANHVQHPSLR